MSHVIGVQCPFNNSTHIANSFERIINSFVIQLVSKSLKEKEYE